MISTKMNYLMTRKRKMKRIKLPNPKIKIYIPCKGPDKMVELAEIKVGIVG